MNTGTTGSEKNPAQKKKKKLIRYYMTLALIFKITPVAIEIPLHISAFVLHLWQLDCS